MCSVSSSPIPAVGSSSKQQPRFAREGDAHLDDALIAVRELACDAVGLLLEVHGGEQLFDAARHLAPARGAEERAEGEAHRRLDRDAQIFVHGEVGEDLGDLEGADDAARDEPRRAEAGDLPPVEEDPPRARREESADQVEERCLPRAVRPDHGAELALLDREVDFGERLQRAEPARHAVELQEAHPLLRRASTPSSPRGKKSTTRMNISPITESQFLVRLLA